VAHLHCTSKKVSDCDLFYKLNHHIVHKPNVLITPS